MNNIAWTKMQLPNKNERSAFEHEFQNKAPFVVNENMPEELAETLPKLDEIRTHLGTVR
jgi:hypothetical protein